MDANSILFEVLRNLSRMTVEITVRQLAGFALVWGAIFFSIGLYVGG